MSEREPRPLPPVGYADRLLVPDERKPWGVEYPEYNPPRFTTDWVLTEGVRIGISDPEDHHRVDFTTRPSFEGEYGFDGDRRPLNPMGRQGIAGRGDLAKWGPNNAADPVVMAVDPGTGSRKVLLVRRRDTGQWAIPGGMVDPGENVSQAALRELHEEAGIDLRHARGVVIYQGYVDDPRNTDNAWMETDATLFVLRHAPEATAGDDAADARWFDASSMSALVEAILSTGEVPSGMTPLYASHSQILRDALGHVGVEGHTAN